MKKIFILTGISAFLILSCVGSPGIVFDDSVPTEQTAWFYSSNIGKITGYNGIAVDWKPRAAEFVQIPAGDTLLELDVDTVSGNYNYKGKDMAFNFGFKPMKKYMFLFQSKDGVYGLNVYAYDFEEKITSTRSDNDTHFVAFVPFLNAKSGK